MLNELQSLHIEYFQGTYIGKTELHTL
jgi:hypothetical protein